MAYEDEYQMVRVPIDVWALIKATGAVDRRDVGQQLTHLVEQGVASVGYDTKSLDLQAPVAELHRDREERRKARKAKSSPGSSR